MFGIYAALGRMPGAVLDDSPDMMRLITGLPHELLNGVFRAHLAPDAIDASIEAAIAGFRVRGLPMTWWTGPATEPADLGRHLEEHGLVRAGDLHGMAVDIRAPLSMYPGPDMEGFVVTRVRDEPD